MILTKKGCKGNCGRRVLVVKEKHGPTPKPLCNHCKQYGESESRRQHLELNKKCQNTIYT